jgi:hypothetical protein
VGTAHRLDGIAEVRQQLAVLPTANVLHGVGNVLHGVGTEGRRAKVSGNRFADLVDPGGVPADVQEAGDRGGPGLDHPGLKVAGGAGDAGSVHIGEHPQSGRLVGYPICRHTIGVLSRVGQPRRVRSTRQGCVGSSPPSGRPARTPVDLTRMAHRRNADRFGVRR